MARWASFVPGLAESVLELPRHRREFVIGECGRIDAIAGNLQLCRPSDPVENHLSEIVVGPVGVHTHAGKTEATCAIFALGHPCQVLWFHFTKDNAHLYA